MSEVELNRASSPCGVRRDVSKRRDPTVWTQGHDARKPRKVERILSVILYKIRVASSQQNPRRARSYIGLFHIVGRH